MSAGGMELGRGEYIISVNADGAIEGLQKFNNSVDRTSQKTKASVLEMAGTFTGLAASAASLYFSFDNLERSEIRVEQAHLRVERAQDKVNKLQKEGKTNTEDYQRAIEALGIAHEREDILSKQVTETQTYMALSLVTMATTTIPTTIKAIQGLTISTEAFGTALDTVAPYLLAATAAFLAWEYAITPVIKSQTGLDLGIQSNIEKMMSQHKQLSENTMDFQSYNGILDQTDTSLSTTAGGFDNLSSSIGNTTKQLTDMEEAFSQIKTNGFFTDKGESLLGQNDPFSQAIQKIDQIQQIRGDIDKLMKGGYDEQTAINMVTDHYVTLLQEEAFQHQESNSQLQKKVDLLKESVSQAEKLLDVTTNINDQSKKKAEIVADLAKTTGLPEGVILASFQAGGAGNAFNPGLQSLWEQGLRNFGQVFAGTDRGQKLGMFGARPFIEGVGYSGISSIGVNTSTSSGILHNNDEWNRLVDLMANEHMFGGLFARVKDDNRIAVENGEAFAQARFEQSSPEWQKFYALKQNGLFNGDPNLSLEDNLSNAVKQYDSIFAPLRSDIARKLQESHTSTAGYLTGDNRTGMSYVTTFSYTLPSTDELNLAKLDSMYSSEADFQAKVKQVKSVLGIDLNGFIQSALDYKTHNDIEAELEYQRRLAAASSGATR